jgi:hypothetical protein
MTASGSAVLSERTKLQERHLRDRHLGEITSRRVQEIDARDVARLLRAMRDTYSPWTCVAVYRIMAGTFALAVRRGILSRSPIDGLAPAERPTQRNAKRVAVLDVEALEPASRGGHDGALAGGARPRGLRWAAARRDPCSHLGRP